MALKDFFSGNAWQQWPEDIRLRWQNAIDYYTDKLQENILFYKFLQFIFLKQWKRLKAYANAQGIDIIGDIPIYVAYDSADTWANPYLFQFNENLNRRPLPAARRTDFPQTDSYGAIRFTTGRYTNSKISAGGYRALLHALNCTM